MIEEEQPPIEGEPEPESEMESEPVEPRTKSPWKAFILTGLLAGLIGAAGGGFGAYAALKKFSPAPVQQAEVDLSPIEARLTQLSERVTQTEALALETANNPTVEFEPVDMSGMEARLTALETAPTPEIDPEALTALQAAQKDGFEWPDTTLLEDRIAVIEARAETTTDTTALEGRIGDLEARSEEISNAALAATAVSPEMMDRLKALEIELETLRNAEPVTAANEAIMSALDARVSAMENRPPPIPVVERVAILAFPKSQMIAAVEANMDGGMIKKTLSRHIRVKDENDPLTLIDGIETDLIDGRLRAAAEKFERLPSPVRAKGQAWYDSVKASL